MRSASVILVLLLTVALAATRPEARAHSAGQTPAAPVLAADSASETIAARRHFFGSENVAADGRVRSDRVILSWFSVASVAMAIDGHVVLLDTYIHKGEDRPNYVPTTTREVTALDPEVIFLGHGHFDHAKSAGVIAAATGALIVGTPEHCDQAVAEAASAGAGPEPVRCMDAVDRASEPGAELRELRPLGERIAVTALKHVHSAAEPPDGEGHETSLMSPAPPDASQILLHPPGPSLVPGLNPEGEEGGTLLYQFRLEDLSLVWHDSAGPLRSRAPEVLDLLRGLPATDVEVGATLGFNDPTNGMRDPVDYFMALRPRYFLPVHHDFVAEYGTSKNLEGVFRREAARRGPLPGEVRWLYDPYDYLRPSLATFDLEARPVEHRGCLARRSPIGPANIGRVRLGLRRNQLLRQVRPQPTRVTRHSFRWCVKGSSGRVTAVFASASRKARARLVATTAITHGNRGVRPATKASKLRRAYPALRSIGPGLYRASPGSRRVIVVRGGRVRLLAVARGELLRNPAKLRAYLGRI